MRALYPDLPKGCWQLYRQYQDRARNRGIKWRLGIYEFARLTQAPCVYCLRPPAQRQRKGHDVYNGLDRLEDSKGYVKANVVTACGECNGLKSNRFTPEETRIMAQALLRFRQGR